MSTHYIRITSPSAGELINRDSCGGLVGPFNRRPSAGPRNPAPPRTGMPQSLAFPLHCLFEKGCQTLSKQRRAQHHRPRARQQRPPAAVKGPIQTLRWKRFLGAFVSWRHAVGAAWPWLSIFPCNVLQPRPGNNGVIHCTRSRGTECESPGEAGLRARHPE